MIQKIEPFSVNEFPDIFVYNEENPIISSPNSPFVVTFAQTRDSLLDAELYKNFLYSAISRFRTSNFYKHYKAHLLYMGINRCQCHPNIQTNEDDEMATIEMHHFVLTIFDIAYIITEHILNTYGKITTFELVELMRKEHEAHRVCTVFLCKTCHQKYHSDPDFYIPLEMGFGDWYLFLEKYNKGISRDIALKIYYLIKKEIVQPDINIESTKRLLKIRDNVLNWGEYYEKFSGNQRTY